MAGNVDAELLELLTNPHTNVWIKNDIAYILLFIFSHILRSCKWFQDDYKKHAQ